MNYDMSLRDARAFKERLAKAHSSPEFMVLPRNLINSMSALQNVFKGFENFIF